MSQTKKRNKRVPSQERKMRTLGQERTRDEVSEDARIPVHLLKRKRLL